VKIYVAVVEGSGKEKDRVIDGFLSFTPPLNANVVFCRFFFLSHPVYDQTQDTGGYLYCDVTKVAIIQKII